MTTPAQKSATGQRAPAFCPPTTTRVDDRLPVEDPATRELLGTVPVSDAADVDRVVAAARAAFPEWRRTPVVERVRLLFHLETEGYIGS